MCAISSSLTGSALRDALGVFRQILLASPEAVPLLFPHMADQLILER
jgi:hypothetical protein